MKDEKMKNVTGGNLNVPLKEEMLEKLQHEILTEGGVEKDVALKLMAAMKRFHTIKEFLDQTDNAEKIMNLLKLEGILSPKAHDVNRILLMRNKIFSKHFLNSISGGVTDFDDEPVSIYLPTIRPILMRAHLKATTAEKIITALQSLHTMRELKGVLKDVAAVRAFLKMHNITEIDDSQLQMFVETGMRLHQLKELRKVVGGADCDCFDDEPVSIYLPTIRPILMRAHLKGVAVDKIMNALQTLHTMKELKGVLKDVAAVRAFFKMHNVTEIDDSQLQMFVDAGMRLHRLKELRKVVGGADCDCFDDEPVSIYLPIIRPLLMRAHLKAVAVDKIMNALQSLHTIRELKGVLKDVAAVRAFFKMHNITEIDDSQLQMFVDAGMRLHQLKELKSTF